MPTLDETRLERIKPWMQGYVDERKFAGSSVLVQQAGQEVFYHDTGFRDVAGGTSFARDTVARIYSMTKPVTSLALMMLVEEGRIHLDAPLSAVLPEFKDMHALVPGATSMDQVERAPVPTLHQTVTHTAGFSYPFNPGVLPRAMEAAKLLFGPSEGSLEEVTRRLAQMPLAFQPGTRWEYSVGIDVIGRVVEVLSGQSLDAFFQTRIFDPLGMTETGFAVPQDALDRFASLYTPLASGAMALNNAQTKSADTLRCVDVAEKSPFRAPRTLSGGGGLVGTIDDYMRFCEALRTGGQSLVSPATLRFMMANHLPGEIADMGPSSFAEQPMTGMGFGIGGSTVLNPARTRTPSSVGDFSWGGMASTFFWIDPVHDLSVVFFTQLSPSSSYPARPELKALIHGALP
ncbi:serine hydrolase domain-containing protein [Pseudosulfitobacter koreensis]|uniref:Beta-lactamase family protein n=1 Tax=Pseudosulfitobacter koreensis TaxID=2968472 RepID=A0ABT1Z074_9RHOB|nr:serine hydrolase domain-containing protein [Pseudosulfitobacter koreense]MCR8826549.1 beta-lactamase family protein [Pseudosulfitobacter koreense]